MPDASALQAQRQRVRDALAHAIAQDPVALAGADPAQPGFAPFERRMEQMIGPLREKARQHKSARASHFAMRQRIDLGASARDRLASPWP